MAAKRKSTKTSARKKSTTRKSASKKTGTRKKSSTKTAAKKKSGTKKAAKKKGTRRYGPKAQKKVGKVMHEAKHGQLHSGRSGKKVTNRKQAIAIALSEARKAGAKVPRKKKS